MDRFSYYNLPFFKIYDKILAYPKCATKYLNKIYGEDGSENMINFYELFNYKMEYIILRNPESHFISAVNESLKYENSLKKIIESLLVGKNPHWHPNHYKFIKLYISLNPIKSIVLLENLMDFLEHKIKIKPISFNDDHKTEKLFDMKKLKEEEPYLMGLILEILNFENQSYQNILSENKVYKKNLI